MGGLETDRKWKFFAGVGPSGRRRDAPPKKGKKRGCGSCSPARLREREGEGGGTGDGSQKVAGDGGGGGGGGDSGGGMRSAGPTADIMVTVGPGRGG